jgi:hypothetical protein
MRIASGYYVSNNTLLSRPETMQALLSLVMSTAGRGSIPLGSMQVPPAAFANAISELAAQAAEVAGVLTQDRDWDHLVDALGNLRCDVVNPAERAALLVTDVLAAGADEADDEEVASDEPLLPAWKSVVYIADPLDSYEAALQGWDSNAE